jgi:hypothetical protein
MYRDWGHFLVETKLVKKNTTRMPQDQDLVNNVFSRGTPFLS